MQPEFLTISSGLFNGISLLITGIECPTLTRPGKNQRCSF
jgi:hypothetical protein